MTENERKGKRAALLGIDENAYAELA